MTHNVRNCCSRVAEFSNLKASSGSQDLFISGLSAIPCAQDGSPQESQMVTTFQASHLAPCRGRRGWSCTLLLEARMPSQKLSSGLPQMSNGQNCVTCPCSRPIAGTRNGAQRLGKINQNLSPGKMRPTQGGRRWRPEQNRSSVRAEGGRGCLYQPTAGEDLTTHSYSRKLFSNPVIWWQQQPFSDLAIKAHVVIIICLRSISAGLLGYNQQRSIPQPTDYRLY